MRRIVYAPEAEAHLTRLYRYIAVEASPVIARDFTDAIVDQCESPEHRTKKWVPVFRKNEATTNN